MLLAGSGGDQDAEPGARLTCHLLLKLFKANDLGNGQCNGKTGGASIKSSTDKHLMSAAHQSITVGAVVAVLKSILMLGMLPSTIHCFLPVCYVSLSNLAFHPVISIPVQ